MIDAVAAVIETVRDAAAKPRLRRCLPHLWSAIEQIDTRKLPGHLVVAAATPQGATVLTAACWPHRSRSTVTKAAAVAALSTAIDVADSDSILTGLTLLLGRKGMAAQQSDAAQILEDGGQPLVVVLVEREQGNITALVTTIDMPTSIAATLH